ncbi:predicted transcriptional regulator [Microbacterium testaceum StLB037]|uniref:Predicted transcriptional regulator n=1 Tax=Microbacterium testaceum (strain StLB037) TaxID=979556 RepID=E8NG79_MICTS|nr:WYL domain-containing protein [Microbacterium testaceum]BAJ76550.1 predicted transcriptional regulator [Microbacterium testaceum StLB037]
MPATTSRSAPEERLVNLVVALMATEQGLTKETILSSVAGYREQLEAGASKDALEKMFERDKENLRGLGIPIETIGERADPDDLREARYRVPTAEYALPEDISFSPAEIALLNIAGDVWGTESLSADARSGLRKIRALGIPVDEPIIGYAPRIRVRDASFPAFQRAIEECRVVTFSYLRPGEPRPRERRIRPLALVEYEARWHVFGFDLTMDADRTFLLPRVVGDVTLTREKFPSALRVGAGERALAGLAEVADRQRALLEVHPGTEASLRLARRALPAPQGVVVPYVDLHVFADELASYGPEVRVVEPSSLRDEVIRRLEATLVLHGGAA